MGASSIVFGFLSRVVASIFFVAVILLLAAPTRDVLVTTASGLWRWQEVRDHLVQISSAIGKLADEADARFDRLKSRPASEAGARLVAIDAELDQLSHAPRLASTSYLDLAKALAQGQLEAALAGEFRRRVLLQERDGLRQFQLYAQATAGRQGLEQHVKHLDALRASAKQREVAAQMHVKGLEARAWCSFPLTDCAFELSKARQERQDANAEAWRSYREWETAHGLLLRTSSSAGGALIPAFRTDRASLQAMIDDMSLAVGRVASFQVGTAQAIWDAIYGAGQIVAAALAFGVAMKALLYFGLARFAERQPPLVVRPATRRSTSEKLSTSAVSLQVVLSPNEELIVVGSHLQSVGDGASTRTQWLLSAAHPLTSLLSGLWMMTRLSARQSCTVVLSATTDALEELNTVTLREGDALVLLPKHLVAVIHPSSRHARLRGHWKGGIHAALTLQFRYLVFEGPCTLIVGGCRGVRLESAEGGRSVSQAMTVGFSSNLGYSVARTETFVAYLLGQRPLFNDRFQGPGVVLYQEVPSTAQRRGFTGRGLQGVVDGAMKAFGL